MPDETRDETVSTTQTPTEPGNASERPSQASETTTAREALDAVLGGLSVSLAEAGKELRRNLEALGLVPASERANAGQDDASARAVERAAWAMWRADGEPTGVAKRDPYRKLARALEADGLLGPWTELREAIARADAAEAKLDEAAQQAATAERNWYTLSHIVGAIEDDPADDVFELARKVVSAADRADAAEAKLREITSLLTGYYDDEIPTHIVARVRDLADGSTEPRHDGISDRLTAERDEARAKLDQVRGEIAKLDDWHGRRVDLPFVELMRMIVGPEATQEQAQPVELLFQMINDDGEVVGQFTESLPSKETGR